MARQNSSRDRENVMESLRKTTSATGPANPNNTASRESSRNASPQSNKPPKTEDKPNTSFDEEKTRTHVHSLIEEYTENYTDSNDRPVLVSQSSIFDNNNNDIWNISRKLSKILLAFARQILINKLLLFKNYLPMS